MHNTIKQTTQKPPSPYEILFKETPEYEQDHLTFILKRTKRFLAITNR